MNTFDEPHDLPYIQRDQFRNYTPLRSGKTRPEDIQALLPGNDVKGLVLTGGVIGSGATDKLARTIQRIIEGTYVPPSDTKDIPDS